MSSPALNPLVDKIRTAHSGVYDDMDDATLTKKVLAKYPQYSDLAVPPQTSMPGAPSTQPVEPAKTGILDRLVSGPSDVPAMPNKVPQSIMGAPDSLGDTIGGLTLAGAGAMGAGAAGAGRLAPYVVPAAASIAINRARELPVIGPIIKHIPFAEMIPWMFSGGKGEKPGGLPDATRENVPYAGEEPPTQIESETAPQSAAPSDTILSPVESTPAPETPAPAAPKTRRGRDYQIPQDEWDAGHDISTQIENTPIPRETMVPANGNGEMRKLAPNEDMTPILKQSVKKLKVQKQESAEKE